MNIENRFYNAWDFDRTVPLSQKARPDHRTPFEHDRDKVIYTSAFRRLQAKTQVFMSGEYDFYRTRLTHSIEVAQIGRAICRMLGGQAPLAPDFYVDADLVEGVCLSHDLGHPPFGHAGERTLHRLMRAEYGGFEGNAQSLRLVAERIYSGREGGRRGMNPTRAFLDGILKYKSLHCEMENPENHFLYDEQKPLLQFVFGDSLDALPPAGKPRNNFRSIECQIMDWADDTAYSINDVVDGIRAGFLRIENIERWAESKNLEPEDSARVEKLLGVIRSGNPDAVFGKKVGSCIQACSLTERDGPLAGVTNRYRFQLEVAEPERKEIALYKRLAFELVFRSPQIQQLEHKGDYVLGRIFDAFRERYIAGPDEGPRLLPEQFEAQVLAAEGAAARARVLCDYLSGMTDGFAVRTYKRLFDPDYGSISDLT